MTATIRALAAAASLALAGATTPLFAAPIDYAFEPVKTDVKNGAGSELAVRIVHKPTGIQVTCSVERSQQQNKRLAMAILTSKIEALEQAKRDAELREVVGDPKAIGFGNQIRNYVLDDRRVKDVRTGVETTNVESVLDRGELDQFIDAELRRRKAAKK